MKHIFWNVYEIETGELVTSAETYKELGYLLNINPDNLRNSYQRKQKLRYNKKWCKIEKVVE